MNCNKNIKEIRVYCECYEQGLYLLNYIKENEHLKNVNAKIVYTKPGNFSKHITESKISQLLKHKNFDGIISLVDSNSIEHPITTIEFSTAVPTDDHILQRFDVMYWSTYYNVPCIKISPTEMFNTDFGGGSRIKIKHEYNATVNMGGVYYHIDWPLIKNTDLVKVDSEKISCPPFLKDLDEVLNSFVNNYFNSTSDNEFFNLTFNQYKKFVLKNYPDTDLRFPNSTRYQFDDKGNLTMKFNRFGHGMDPERGMLIFWSQKLDNKPIVKFEVQRRDLKKYKSLYEGNNYSIIMKIVENEILKNGNIVTFDIAFDLFKKATTTDSLFKDAVIDRNVIVINDEALIKNLAGNTSVINNLLHFSEKIILTDLDGNIIVEIKWNNNKVEEFYLQMKNERLKLSNKELPLQIINNNKINEDVITYACMSVFMKNNMKNIAVSYPGAQGDRKILQGNGVTTKRDYVDIISIKKCDNDEYYVMLQENKKKISETGKSDINKLYSIRLDKEKMQELNNLINFTYTPISIKDCHIGIGGQASLIKQGETKIDYLTYIEISNDGNIKWSISTSKPSIFEIFKDVANEEGCLNGIINLDYPMYVVK